MLQAPWPWRVRRVLNVDIVCQPKKRLVHAASWPLCCRSKEPVPMHIVLSGHLVLSGVVFGRAGGCVVMIGLPCMMLTGLQGGIDL